jgi:AcrR family transcriptional regulator
MNRIKPKQDQKKSEAMNGFARRKELSREEIRKAAWDLFSQFGVERVSMSDIAKKASVSQATIYNNFENKDALAHEFVTSIVDQLIDSVQEVLVPDIPFGEKLTAFIQFVTGMNYEKPTNVDRTVFTSSIDLQKDPEIRKIHDAAQQRMTKLLLGLVQEGKDQGEINRDISKASFEIYFKTFMDVFTDSQLQYRFGHQPELVKDLMTLMMFGLYGEKKK